MTDSIRESLLQQMWREPKRYLVSMPRLTDGTVIEILHPGEFNDHRGGPDFLGGEIVVDGLRIKGDIELHRSTSDWNAHGHTDDPKYFQVVLHVVMDHDEAFEPRMPTLILRDNLSFDERSFWQELFERRYARAPELPCFPHNLSVPMKSKLALVRSMTELRLEELVARYTTDSYSELLDRVYERVLDALGFSENREPMRELSAILPRTLLQRVRANEKTNELPAIFEALYFGAAGLLSDPSNDYTASTNEYLLDLRSKWQSVSVTYSLDHCLAKSDWSFFRIRPVNSPYRRVALAASLATRYFSNPDATISDEIVFSDPDNWWLTHTSFTSELESPHSLLGKERESAIELNVLLPARIARARMTGMNNAEKHLVEKWKSLKSHSSAAYMHTVEQELLEGEKLRDTASEQGALHLYRTYCSALRCAECPVGKRLIERGWSGIATG